MSIIQGNSKTSAGGYSIDQSIRFNDNDSAYLSRTPGSAGNRKKFTLSWWWKPSLSDVSANDTLFEAYSGANNYFAVNIMRDDATFSCELYFQSQVSNVNVINKMTAQVFRDPSAWYHCVLVIDTDNATAEDRNQLYVNGVRVTSWFSGINTNSSSGHTTYWNNTNVHYIGSAGGGSYFDGYMAEIHNIDGQALDASSFGEVNADSGQWVPIAYTGSMTGNSFYITGEDSADLGADYSGLSNDWTSSGLTSADQVTDTPTDNWSTWNSLSGTWIYPATFSDGNLTAIRSSAGTNIVGSTISFPATGNWYAEFTIDATGSGSFIWQVGIIEVDDAERFDTVEPRLGSAAKGYAYTTNWSGSPVPSKQNNGSASSYGTAGSATDVIGVHLNNGTLVFYHNNVSQGTAYSGITGEYIFAWSGQSGAKVTANFGQSGFTYTPPSSAVAVTTANLPDPTIALPTDYFTPLLYAGSSSVQSVTGVGFSPDLLWIKNRSAAAAHIVFDKVRGAGATVYPSLTNAEDVNTTKMQSFDSDGFTLGGGYAEVNTAGNNFVSWNWYTGGGSGTSVGQSGTGDGAINACTYSASPSAGFSIITFTGYNSTISNGQHTLLTHGLGAAPDFYIIKNRDSASNWIAIHKGMTSGFGDRHLVLNSTAAQSGSLYVGTAPTSTYIKLGNEAAVNANAADFICYAWAEVESFSKFGSYTGNGSATDGPFVYCGFRPAFLMYKVASGTTDSWEMYDTVRQTYNVYGTQLKANLSNAETNDVRVDILSNGFKARSSNTAVNSSGATYIFMAFAESPFKTANAR